MKNPLTPVGIEPATFRFVAQHLNHCAIAVPLMRVSDPLFKLLDYHMFQHSFLSLNLMIGWQLSICNCCKPLFPLLCKCQLLCSCRLALKYRSPGLPTAFFPNIAPSRMFATNSLCLTLCPIHERSLFFKIFKSNLSPFAL